MNTSERLRTWIIDLNLYEEFFAWFQTRRGQLFADLDPEDINAEYEELAIEFLQKHLQLSAADQLRAQFRRHAKPEPTSVTPLSAHDLEVVAADIKEMKIARRNRESKPTDPWGAPTDTRGYPE